MKQIILVLAIIGLWAVPAWANHSQSTGINCSNFAFQEDAQAYFNLHPGDPEGLDGPPGPAFAGIQNVACEDLPHRPATTTTTVVTTTTLATTTTSTPVATATGGSTSSGGSGGAGGSGGSGGSGGAGGAGGGAGGAAPATASQSRAIALTG